LVACIDRKSGYRDVAACEEHFLAVGTKGKIDCIDKLGKITALVSNTHVDLNCVIYENNIVVAVGEKGIILISTDRQIFRKVESGIDASINCVTFFNGVFIAAADNGTILIFENENKRQKIKLPLKGDIVSVSAGISKCIGVTDKGEIISTKNTLIWDIFNYNFQYEGFRKPCVFKNVIVTNNWIVIVGWHKDNTPVTLFSSQGNVWIERVFIFTNEYGITQVGDNLPNDIAHDVVEDQFFVACNNGEVLNLPSCTKCNRAFTLTEKNLQAVQCSGNILMIVGDDFYINAIHLK
jgi:hypothetical protein